jgi:N-acetylglucosaminyldiphosphoundecaprenol N-acetyl-beta-D-mannosaminyltransferase
MKIDVLGVKFDSLTMDEAVDRALDMLSEDGTQYVVTPNPEIVWMCEKDGALTEAVSGAAMVLPDGVGIIHASKILKRPLKEKIPGVDFAERLLEKYSARNENSVFLFGAKPGVAEDAAKNLKERFPGLNVAGTADGYFKDEDELVGRINAADADLLIVCLGAPLQEKWMARNRERLNARLMLGLGGSLDVYAGKTERAPEGWQKAGLEWLYRGLKDPRRIKRMAMLPLFVVRVCVDRLRGR